jgi:hypothetical protein
MRKAVAFLLAVAMVVAGLYVLASKFLWGHHLGRLGVMGAFLTTTGISVLWVEFLEPIFVQRKKK